MSDYRTTDGEPLPLTRREQRRRRWRIAVGVIGGGVLIVLLGFMIRANRHVTASGYVTAENYAEVRPTVAGVVTEILVRTGDTVEAGDLLVQLADAEDRAAYEEAVSLKRKVEAEISRREAELKEEQRRRGEQVAILKLKQRHAVTQRKLMDELQEKGLASGRALENARLNEELASAELKALEAADDSLAEKELTVLRRELDAREKAAVRVQSRMDSRRLAAPIGGTVVRYSFGVGELVKPDMVLYEVFGGTRQVLKLQVPERYATRVEAGQPYRARLVPYHGLSRQWFTGTVERLRDVMETQNDRTYRMVYCTFDPGTEDVPPGTTARAEIRTGRSSFWAKLLAL